MRIPIITTAIVLIIGYNAISSLWRPAPPPKPVVARKPLEPVAFDATVVNVRKITRGSSTRAERYELILAGAPAGQDNLNIYPDKIIVDDEDMRALIGTRASFSCERYVGEQSCWKVNVIGSNGRQFVRVKD